MIWKYFIIHPIRHLVSLSTEHLHYLRANPKELTTQYHFLECDHRINKLESGTAGFQDAFRSSVSRIQTSANNIGSSISNAIRTWNWSDTWGPLQNALWSFDVLKPTAC